MKRTLLLAVAAAAVLLLSPFATSRKPVRIKPDATPTTQPEKNRVRPNPMVAYAQEAEPRKIDADVHPPKVVKKIEPAYTEEARAARLEGTVLLKLTIDVDGKVKDIKVARGLGLGLDERAVEALAAWEFEPSRLIKDNSPVAVTANVEMNFRLR